MTRGLKSSRRVIQGHRFGERAVLVQQANVRLRGQTVKGAVVTTKVRLASAPLTVQSLYTMREVLPEGLRLSQARQFWMVTPRSKYVLPIRVEGEKSTGDIIRYRETDFRVIYHTDYSEEGFIEIIGSRPD